MNNMKTTKKEREGKKRKVKERRNIEREIRKWEGKREKRKRGIGR